MSALLHTRRLAGFDTIEFDSPATRNALSIGLLTAALDAVRRSSLAASRGLVLRHTGTAFCAGVDLGERRRLGPEDRSHSELLAALLKELWNYPKPVVVSIDGAVRGGGLGLLACADVVLATERSTFAYSEARVGVAPALVMAVTLPLTPARTLLPRLLDGAVFGAGEAHRLGLVSLVVGDEQAGALDGVLGELRLGAPDAQVSIKRIARQHSEVDMVGLIEEMTSLSAELFAGDEAGEGVAAFAERRPTRWALDGAVS